MKKNIKKKIVIHLLSSEMYSGAENVACTIIDIQKKNYDNYYCSPEGDIREILNEKKINYIALKKLSYMEVRRVIKKFKPDIIHAHDYKASILASLFSKNVKIISHIHKNDPKMKRLSIKSILYAISLNRITSVIGVSNSVLDECYYKSMIKKKFIFLPNYVDKNKIIHLSEENLCKKKYDLYYFGRLSEEKNPLLFIKIVKMLNIKEIRCVMIGDGPLINECRKLVHEYSLENNIDIIGFQKNPYPYVKKSNIGIMPSKYEGFGLTAIESIILGKIVLNSGVGGLKEIYSNNKEFICKSVSEYVNKINSILLNNSKYEIMCNEIIEKYTNISTWKNILKDIYR